MRKPAGMLSLLLLSTMTCSFAPCCLSFTPVIYSLTYFSFHFLNSARIAKKEDEMEAELERQQADRARKRKMERERRERS